LFAYISSNETFSKRGNVRFDLINQKIRCFHTIEYRQGVWEQTTLAYVRFLYIDYGSVGELETQTMLSGDLVCVGKERLQKLRTEIGDVERMLKALIKSLENKHLNP
jgi:four helix bundle protein